MTMRVAMFYHSLVSDWNHGNAHFLRGVATELISLRHDVRIYEPCGGWSRANLLAEFGDEPIREFEQRYPALRSRVYDEASMDLDRELDGVDLALVHEWNSHSLVRRIGEWRARTPAARLLFHDTHHRAATDPGAMSAYDLSHYDGVLAYGEVIRRVYLDKAWTQRAWTWHEAADTRVFRPVARDRKDGDIVWIGNWGDEERTAELHEFLLEPVKSLGLKARVHGVRYPPHALDSLAAAGIEYGGWLPNYKAPEVFARFTATVHVPRRPYVQALPGIPTIRPFEALACAIPLVSSPWDDVEHLFRPGQDYLVARDGGEMKRMLRELMEDDGLRAELKLNGLETILSRHTCAHRVRQLLGVYHEIAPARAAAETATK